jgi:hypothetical protein
VMNALATPLFGLWRAQAPPSLLAPRSVQADADTSRVTRFGGKDRSTSVARHAGGFGPVPQRSRGRPQTLRSMDEGAHGYHVPAFHSCPGGRCDGQVQTAKPLPWYLRLLEVSRPLHFGDGGGLPLKVFMVGARHTYDRGAGRRPVSLVRARQASRRTRVGSLSTSLRPVAKRSAVSGRTQSLWGIYKQPFYIGAVTFVGLIFGVLGDGVWDPVSWIGLAVPVLLTIWFLIRARPRRNQNLLVPKQR